MKIHRLVFIFFLLSILEGCKEPMKIPHAFDNDLQDIEDKAIEALEQKRIFFGHMSVGDDIVQGIEEIKARSRRFHNIQIRKLKGLEELRLPGIYHAENGTNGFPKSKIDAFKNLLEENGLGNKLDIAFFKFCYIDFHKDSPVEDIFNSYAETVESIKREFPRLKIIHVTVPLYVHGWRLKGLVKNIIKGDLPNVKRNEFNKQLIRSYKDVDPIYDLAQVESTLPDGSRIYFKDKGNMIFSLAKEYTTDGGHLNDLGRFCAAKDLLRILCGK